MTQLRPRLRKNYFYVVLRKTRKQRFQKYPLWKVWVYDNRFHGSRVNRRPKPIWKNMRLWLVKQKEKRKYLRMDENTNWRTVCLRLTVGTAILAACGATFTVKLLPFNRPESVTVVETVDTKRMVKLERLLPTISAEVAAWTSGQSGALKIQRS